MCGRRFLAVFAAAFLLCFQAFAGGGEGPPLKKVDWSFDGMFGQFDRQSLQRGFQVYKEVCSACHGIKRISFRNLEEIGFSIEEVQELADDYRYPDWDEDGEATERVGLPTDYFPDPFANDKAAAAANNGKAPPDLSLMVKARFDGANYMHSILTGYEDAPEGVELGTTMSYNPYFTSGEGKILMPPPLVQDGQVTYSDGTEATIEQMSKDVVNFLQWCAEPEMEDRKAIGIKVLIFLLAFTVFFYFAKKNIWSDIK